MARQKRGNKPRPKYYEDFQEAWRTKYDPERFITVPYLNENELKPFGFTDQMFSDLLGDPVPIQEIKDKWSNYFSDDSDFEYRFWKSMDVYRAMKRAIALRLNERFEIPDYETPPKGINTVSLKDVISPNGPKDAYVTALQLRRIGFSKKDLAKLPNAMKFFIDDSDQPLKHWKIEDVRAAYKRPLDPKNGLAKKSIQLNLEKMKGDTWDEICEEYRKSESS